MGDAGKCVTGGRTGSPGVSAGFLIAGHAIRLMFEFNSADARAMRDYLRSVQE